ncbi:hypothetical protein V2W45_1243725 [Cenococcum geophilum]
MHPPLPRRIPRPYRPQCLFLHPSRQFSSTPRVEALPPNSLTKAQRPPTQKFLSPKTLMAQQAAKLDQFPTDVGLLPGTFIRPTGVNIPSIFSSPKDRLTLELRWAKTRVTDIAGQLYYKFFMRKGKPRPRLDRKKLIPLAKDLHQQIYKAFAARDTHALTTLCGSGLLSTFRARLSHRPPSTSVTWTLSRYLSRPRLVSHRTAPLPFPGFPETALRQAIVKIRSVQILTTRSDAQARKVLAEKLAAAEEDEEREGKGTGGAQKLSPELRQLRQDQARARVAPHVVSALGASRVAAATTTAEGELEGGTTVEREVTEFVVLQRLMVKGVEGPWMVWGFGEETTLEGMREEDKRVKAMQEFEAAQNAGV